MPLTIWHCVLSYKQRFISVKISLFFQEITFRTEFPGSSFLLPTFLIGGKWDFQVANLLLAMVNFEHCNAVLFSIPSVHTLLQCSSQRLIQCTSCRHNVVCRHNDVSVHQLIILN